MKSNAMKMYKHLIIAVVIGLIILLAVQPVNGLTVIGVRTLAVMIPTLYLWLTVGTTWTSLLFLGFLVMTGAMTSTEVWAGSVGHFSVISMIVFMMLNYCLTETGVIDLVCSWFITRKIVNNRPYVFLCMFFASMMILGMFMDNLSLAVIYVGIAVVLAEKLGLKKGQPFYTCMFMGIMWVDTVISIASPIAHAPCLILMGYMSTQLGIDVSYGQWLAVGVPFAILMFIVIIICVNIWRPDTSAYINYDVEAEKRNMRPLDTRGKISAAIFIVMLFMILFPELGSGLLQSFCAYWKNVGVIVVAILAVSLLCVIHVDDKPLLDINAAYKSLPMGAIIFAGVVSVMATPVTSEATGINVWMANVLQPLFTGVNPFVVVIALTLGAVLMTNFMSNIVTMTIFFNIGVALLSGGSTNMGMFAMLIGFASSMATLTPSACAPMPLVFGPGHVTMKNSFRVNLIFILLSVVVMFAFVVPFTPFIIH